MALISPRIRPFGDAGLLVELGDSIAAEHAARAQALVRELAATFAGDARFGRPIGGLSSVLVPIDLDRIAPARAGRIVRELVDRLEGDGRLDATAEVEASLSAPVEIAVRYGGRDGPDLAEVAARLSLTTDAVVRLHSERTYRVLALGFVPGFAYLGLLAPELRLPRRAEPRTRVPAGSVAIAAEMSAVYPFETPGGWHLIGRTSTRLWDPTADPPAILLPGAGVRFRPI